jgi:hypothetical protein
MQDNTIYFGQTADTPNQSRPTLSIAGAKPGFKAAGAVTILLFVRAGLYVI